MARVLAYTSPARGHLFEPFEYPRSDWPPNLRLIGACDWDPPAEAPSWLEEIEEPIVLVTTSSEFQDDARLVQGALEALAGEKVHVVATLPFGDPASLDRPANSRVLSFVPHAPILDRAACGRSAGAGADPQLSAARRDRDSSSSALRRSARRRGYSSVRQPRGRR